MGKQSLSYADLAAYCEAHPQVIERYIAASIGVDAVRFSKLKSRKYGLRPTPDEVRAIAKLLNQTPNYVNRLYEKAA